MSYMWERRLRIKSRLIQPRGLKWEASRPALRWSGRGLYSLVDWNMTIRQASAEGQVEAYTASWIEINSNTGVLNPGNSVEAYTASWIEIFFRLWKIIFVSRRGLYSLVDWNKALCVPRAINKGRGLYSLVDWNFGKMYVFSFLHCRGLYSLVDWNFWGRGVPRFWHRRGLYSLVDWNAKLYQFLRCNICRGLYSLVDWNISWTIITMALFSRGLYSLVDWNIWEEAEWTWFNVGAYTASWIEMMVSVNARSCR